MLETSSDSLELARFWSSEGECLLEKHVLLQDSTGRYQGGPREKVRNAIGRLSIFAKREHGRGVSLPLEGLETSLIAEASLRRFP